MKLAVDRSELNQALKACGKSVGSGSTLPILSGVLLEAGEDLTLSATDLESSVYETLYPEIESEGSCVVDWKLLSQIISRLPGDNISLSTDETKLYVESGDSNFELLLKPTEDFPDLPVPPSEATLTYDRQDLVDGIEKVAYASMSAKETSRLMLTGIYWDFRDGETRFVATNGYRLALKPVSMDASEAPDNILVDSDALARFAAILRADDSEKIEVATDGQHLFISAYGTTLTARLIQEEFPDYERVIPEDNSIPVKVNAETFLDALKRVEVTAAEESGAVTLQIQNASLTVTARSNAKGEAEETIPLLGEATDMTVSFRGEYLVDILKHCDEDEVTLWLKDGESAGLIEEKSYRCVVMPIRQDS